MVGGIVTALGLFGVADTVAPAQPLGEYASLSALAVVGVVLIFIVTKMLPDLHGKFVAQSEASAKAVVDQADHFAVAIKAQADSFATILNDTIGTSNARLLANTRELTKLREHCAGRFKSVCKDE